MGLSVALEILQDRISEPPGRITIDRPHLAIISEALSSASPSQPQLELEHLKLLLVLIPMWLQQWQVWLV